MNSVRGSIFSAMSNSSQGLSDKQNFVCKNNVQSD